MHPMTIALKKALPGYAVEEKPESWELDENGNYRLYWFIHRGDEIKWASFITDKPDVGDADRTAWAEAAARRIRAAFNA